MQTFILLGVLLNVYTISCFIVPSGKEPECPGVECRPIDYNTCSCPCEMIPFCSGANQKSKWPLGNYGLPASIYGCPENDWEIRYINMTLSSDYIYWKSSGTRFYYADGSYRYSWSHNKDLHVLGPYSKRNFQLNVCVRHEGTPNNDMGLRGNFCVFKTGTECSSGFEEGNVTIRGYKTDVRGFSSNITTTDGGFVVSFCCRNDNTSNLSDMLPHTSSFVLIKGPSAQSCELIQNMTFTDDVIYLYAQSEDVEFHGILPNMTSSKFHLEISFCVYFPRDYQNAISAEIDISVLRQTYSLCSKEKPCYSAPYEGMPHNNPNFVVDGSWDTVAGRMFSTSYLYRPWLQIDLQEFVYITHVIQIVYKTMWFPGIELFGVYVSKDQWSFINHGAVACFFGASMAKFVCRRPIVGQYLTIVREDDNRFVGVEDVLELEVYGFPLRCGRPLGMISGDIKDFQIETSSNHPEIQYARALQGNRGWCTSKEDNERWIMVDLILPIRVQGVALHGWFQNKNRFINSFMVEYGVRQSNMTLYGEPGYEPKVFNIDTAQNIYVMQKFWFWKERTARYLKIITLGHSQDVACLKLEIIGCDKYKRRRIDCKRDERLGFTPETMDFGFASTRHMSYDYTKNQDMSLYCDYYDDMSLGKCQQLSTEKGFLGSRYKGIDCCYYNISSTNRHYKDLLKRVPEIDYIMSERLCFTDIMDPLFPSMSGIGFPSVLGMTQDIHSLMFPSSYPKGFSTETHYHSMGGHFLKLTIVYISLAKTATTADLIMAGHPEINPGWCKDRLRIDVGTGNEIQITTDNQERYRHASFISSGDTIKIVFESCIQYTTSSDNNVYQLQVETVEHPGCSIDGTQQAFCTARIANIASFLYPSLYTPSDTNVWQIHGQFGQYIELKFIDLDVAFTRVKTTRNIHSFVEVFDVNLDNTALSMGRYYIENKPHVPLISSWHMMNVEFRVGSDQTGRGFFGLYSIVDIVSNSFSNYAEGCADTWYGFQNSCYKVFKNEALDHQKAETECSRNSGHLVAISSKEEMTFVHRLLIGMSNNSIVEEAVLQVYIGLTKKNSGYMFSDYEWSNGEPLIYTAWFNGKGKNPQPDGFDSEQCTAIILDSIHNKHNWHDVPCAFNQIHYFMCESHLNTSGGIKMDNMSAVMDNTARLKFFNSLPVSMKDNMKRCDNGEIVSQFVVCDGYQDCSDKSDEFNCDKTGCTSSQFKCDNNQCVHLTFYCDGISHCDDASDEKDCELPACKEDELQCQNKLCISKDKRCDNKDDCFDKSDEHNCVSCNSDSYQCFDQSCISPSRKCDVIPDCPGRYLEDETDCAEYNTQRSCGEWWTIGFREDGMYRIDYGRNEPEIVYCQFIETDDKVMITTSLYFNETGDATASYGFGSTKSKTFRFPVDMIRSMSKSKEYTCSQNIQVACYFHNVVTDYAESFKQVCNDRCQCVGVHWIKADVNKVLVDDVIYTDPTYLPFNAYQYPDTSYSSEGLYQIKVGPVVCKSETSKNESMDKFLCNNGKMHETQQKCIMRLNEYKDIMGCRDLSHLQHCEDFECPESFFKCTDGYCLSPNLVCDGIKQCRKGEDELKCDNMICSGLFRCQKSTTCLLHDDVCNGIRDCPYGDDEMACNVTCPADCQCDGLVIVCQYNNHKNITHTVPNQARKLDLSHSRFAVNTRAFVALPYLTELLLCNCSIAFIEASTFESMRNLLILDLRQNTFRTLNRNIFDGLHRLRTLKLAGNELLTRIEPFSFNALINIEELEITETGIRQIEAKTFTGLSKLQILNISSNALYSIHQNAFDGLDSLTSIDLSNNEITEYPLEIFYGLNNLFEMRSDSYIFCCIKPESVSPDKCFPQMDEFSSCTDLMRVDLLRICLWIIGIMALVGNLGVIIYRFINERDMLDKAHGFFVMNLGCSDMLMGVYLCMIAVADLYFKGDYILHDKDWRESITCKAAGVIAVVACEASVNFILLITIDCFLMVKFPFGNRRISKKIARMASLICWVLVAFIGILPVLYTSYFSESYYSKTAVCLTLPFSRQKVSGWEYSTIIFVFYNCIAFVIIACCQLSIYNAARSGNRMMAKRTKQDLALARRLFLVVLTDFMCWVPVGVMGILALAGEVFSADVYSWVAVFVMPVNAALNPFLYTFSNVLTKQKMKILSSVSTTMFKVTKIKRNTRDSSDVFVASTFVESRNELPETYFPLKDLFIQRKLSAKESYLLCTQLTTALTYLHQRFLTFCKRISPENVFVLTQHKVIVRIKIISNIRDVKEEDDASEDVEDIGMLAKHILRYTLRPEQTIQTLYNVE